MHGRGFGPVLLLLIFFAARCSSNFDRNSIGCVSEGEEEDHWQHIPHLAREKTRENEGTSSTNFTCRASEDGRSSSFSSFSLFWDGEDRDIISGERLQALAAVTLTTEEWLEWHHSLSPDLLDRPPAETSSSFWRRRRHQVLVMGPAGELGEEELAVLRQSRSVFVYSHLLPQFFLGGAFAAMRKPVLLLSHNNDHEIHLHRHLAQMKRRRGGEKARIVGVNEGTDEGDEGEDEEEGDGGGEGGSEYWASDWGEEVRGWEREAARALEQGEILRWFAQNLQTVHARLSPLPIGQANQQWPHGDALALATAAREARDAWHKSEWLYANFKTSSHAPHRSSLLASLLQTFPQTSVQATSLPYPAYLAALGSHRFALAPSGNGVDTHRAWESLYLRTIPLVEASVWASFFAGLELVPSGEGMEQRHEVRRKQGGLPMVIVHDWSLISEQSLNDLWEVVLERWDGEGAWDWNLLSLKWWRAVVGECEAMAG